MGVFLKKTMKNGWFEIRNWVVKLIILPPNKENIIKVGIDK